MIRTMRAALAAFALALGCSSALAQSSFPTAGGSYVDGHALMCPNGSTDFQGRPVMIPCGGSSSPINISGSFSATLAGFQPTPSFSQLAASDAASHAVAVPSGADDVIQNTSANDAYCTVGATPTATSANILVAAKSSVPVHNGGAFAQIACISPSSTLAINIDGGVGLWTASGGGGGGGSGGGGPLGTQAISNSQAVNPATSSLWTAAQGGAALSATNGLFSNTLQGNAVLSATNGLFSNLLQGNAVLSAANPIFISPATSAGANVTLTACDGTITTGGTAQVAIAAQTTLHGFTIDNTDAASGSGEPLWVSFTTTAAASATGSHPLSAPTALTFAGMGSFTSPSGMGTNHAVSIVGATTGHKYGCFWW
jgi:hypothetical protein